MKAAISTDITAFTARPLSQAQADAIRAAFLVQVDRLSEAQALLNASIAADPKNPAAQETAGFLALRRNNMDAAEKSFANAVALDSQSYLAHYYYAVLSLQRDETSIPGASGAGASGTGTKVEASLRASIRLNPTFAPAYDALATYYGRLRENLDEAHALNIHAITLDPSSVLYRMNAASVLENAGKYDNALQVLQYAEKYTAKTPQDTAMLESGIGQIKRYQAEVAARQTMQEQAEPRPAASSSSAPDSASASASASASGATSVTTVSTTSLTPATTRQPMSIPPSLAKLAGLQLGAAPVFPTAIPAGVKMRTISGVLHNIKCYYPQVTTLDVDEAGHAITLYKNSFRAIDFNAANFDPKGELQPCLQLEGMKARVQYAEMNAAGVSGQIVAILLSR